MVSEISELININQRLVDQVAELDIRVESNRAELDACKSDLKRVNDERSDFVSVISHELKTPLTGIKLFSDLLLNHNNDFDEQEKDRYLGVISAEADRLSRMISNIAEFQNICTGNVHWLDEIVDVVDVVRKCARPFSVLCESKGLGFSYAPALERLNAVFDKERLARLVYNLLSNALAFTRTGAIKLDVKINPEADSFCLSVRDTGLGMSSEQKKQLSSKSMAVPLLRDGVGLYVNKYIVSHYQGEMWVESNAGKGSVFYIVLPLNRVED